MATYSREACEDYVRRALELPDDNFVRLWVYCCGMFPKSGDPQTYKVLMDSMVVEWENMPIWNKQCVMFLMIDHITNIAKDRAMMWASTARIQDPL